MIVSDVDGDLSVASVDVCSPHCCTCFSIGLVRVLACMHAFDAVSYIQHSHRMSCENSSHVDMKGVISAATSIYSDMIYNDIAAKS